MKKTFRHSMAWLHTWSGLLLSWILFAILVTGTATYFRHEITRWMKPELAIPISKNAPAHAIQNSLMYLNDHAPSSENWFISLPGDRSGVSSLMWWNDESTETALIDPSTRQEIKPRDTRGGEFFYRFHFQLQLPYPWGRYLAGVAAMFMFVALISGIITHRQFFKEFFTFRPTRAWLRSCMDFHNVMAVLALPFYLMISFSALVIFMHMYLPWGNMALDKISAPAVTEESPMATPATPPQLLPFDQILALVEKESAGLSLSRIVIRNRGTEKADISLFKNNSKGLSSSRSNQLRFSAITGEKLPLEDLAADGVVGKISDVFYGLHLAHFANPLTRTLFFIMGAMGAAMTGSGMVMWTQKRKAAQLKKKRPSFGYLIVDRLNLASITGLFIAIAVMFWANRLLPTEIAMRELLEVKGFLYAWGLSLLHACCRPIGKAWLEQLWIAAILYLGIPLLDIATAWQWMKISISNGDGLFPLFDLVMALTGASFGWVAWKLATRQSKATPSVISTKTQEA
jgi:uncharacterized iron-regulated membrane protein